MSRQTLAKELLDEIASVEGMAPLGSHEHGQYLRAALEAKWPTIKAILYGLAISGHQQNGKKE